MLACTHPTKAQHIWDATKDATQDATRCQEHGSIPRYGTTCLHGTERYVPAGDVGGRHALHRSESNDEVPDPA